MRASSRKLRRTRFSNRYLLPPLLGSPVDELEVWHGSSDVEPSCVEYAPKAYLQPWTEAEREWASGLDHSPGFQSVRERHLETRKALDTTPPGPERSRRVEERYELER